MAAHTAIIGVGSPLAGDDAVGLAVIEALRARSDIPPDVDIIDGGTDGLGLVPVLERYARVIVVDAVPMGLRAGTVRRFTWAEVRPRADAHALSLHQHGLTEALALAEVLGVLPPTLIVYGVQPARAEFGQPLSAAVARAVPLVVENLLHEVRSNENVAKDTDR